MIRNYQNYNLLVISILFSLSPGHLRNSKTKNYNQSHALSASIIESKYFFKNRYQ